MDFSTIKELESKLAIKSTLKQNICFVRGEGNLLYDTNNRSYMDLAGGKGESCLGYGNGWLTQAITDQANKLLMVPEQYYSEPYGAILQKLLSDTGFNKASLSKSASEATQAALLLAQSYLKEKGDYRKRVIITGSRYFDEPQNSPHMRRTFVEFNNFQALKKSLTPSTAMLIIHPIANDGSLKIADYDYLVNAYALCKSMDIILYCNETHIGIGRTGKKFAYMHYGIQPDIVTVANGLGGGLPIGAVLTRSEIADSLSSTGRNIDLGASALSSVAAGIILDRLEGGTLEDIAEKGEYLLSRLYKLTKYNFVLDVRGKGLLCAVELSGRIMAAKIVSQMEKLGYLLSYTDDNIIWFSPPFTISKAEIDEAIDALSELFSSTNI